MFKKTFGTKYKIISQNANLVIIISSTNKQYLTQMLNLATYL